LEPGENKQEKEASKDSENVEIPFKGLFSTLLCLGFQSIFSLMHADGYLADPANGVKRRRSYYSYYSGGVVFGNVLQYDSAK
jgi:hypothetical protein